MTIGLGPAPITTWVRICAVDDLLSERGAAALVGDRQIALFRTYDGQVHALDNLDPFSGAYVLARGIVGSRGDVPTVTSPMHKQVFDLRTGACLSVPGVAVSTHAVSCAGGIVRVETAR